MKFQPVIKWSGSKRSQSETIISKIPNKEYNTYYEPFCGGCSVLFQLLHSDIKFKNYICSDKNEGLIKLWNEIKYNPIKVADTYEKLWNELNIDDDKERKKQYFYMVRDRYNKEQNPYDFMFIMRTTTNGMPRYNNNGNFNNSFHVTRNGIKPNTLRQIIFEWSEVLNKNNVQFIHQNYQQIKPQKNDFIYLDPPYANTRGMYYGTIDYEQLWNWLRNQDCSYMLSFDGKTSSKDMTYSVPNDIYTSHEYLYSGNSSFRRVIGTSNSEYVSESLYIKEKF
ncbi:Dam family site-specific DNA-(adenine-N6)-methyltransferase [Clostridium botulinum]|uniref:Dam family site-specific DNA-(adenine-N6)-methyltransferase n=1 Tax=Clostridium botulinum TaxID=1491 RepID=UPI001A9C9FFD|nr:Dam family site-specific DNA-(adenine-N6)-methyltransferase [Clostridium botulinum]